MSRAFRYDEPSIFSVADPKALKITFNELGTRRAKYPFAEMRVGDYFEVSQSLADSARSSACNYGKSEDKEFAVRRCSERLGMWICRRML
jgi:hypothetical protein